MRELTDSIFVVLYLSCPRSPQCYIQRLYSNIVIAAYLLLTVGVRPRSVLPLKIEYILGSVTRTLD